MPLQRVELAVAGAVHRLERHRPVLVLGHEHVVAVLVPVARGLPQRAVVELRRLDLAVAARAAHLAAQLRPASCNTSVPAGSQNAEPGRHVGEREQAELRPERRWSLARARSSRSRYSSRSLVEKNAVPYTRVSIGLVASPRQYAPATDWSLNALIRFVLGAWGPRQRSVKGPLVYRRDRLDALVRGPGPRSARPCSPGPRTGSARAPRHGDVLADERLVGVDVLAHLRLDPLEVGLADSATPSGKSKS